jgi:hypothetical protein
MKIQAEDMLTGTPTAIKWLLTLIEEVELAQVVISRGARTKEGITFPPVKIKYYCLKFELLSANRNKKTCRKLTCFAIPKSASFTRPLGSTNMFAPLMSLQI